MRTRVVCSCFSYGLQSSLTTSRTFASFPEHIINLCYAADFFSVIRNLSHTPRDPRALAALDSALAGAHLRDSATAVLLLCGLSSAKKLVRAKSLLSRLRQKGVIPDPFLYSIVFQCLLGRGTVRDVEAVWAEISPPPGGASTIDASDFVVHLCRRGGEAAEIEWAYRRISSDGWDLSREGYLALIGAVSPADPFFARTVLWEMEEKGLEADNLTYFALFQSFCRSGNPLEADSILKRLVERNYDMDICIYGNLLHALCRSGKLREARKLFGQMTKKARPSNSPPDVKTGRRVIFQLGSCRSTVPESMAYEAYFRALCKAGQLEDAEKLLKVMMGKETVPAVCVHGCFVEALFRAGRLDDAIGFFDAERKKGHVSVDGMAAAVIRGLCELRRVDDACKILREMVDGGLLVPTGMVHNWILRSYWKEGRMAEAIAFFEDMQVENHGGCCRPDAWSYQIMIDGIAERGNIVLARALMEQMIREKIPTKVSLYEPIVRRLCVSGKLEEAHEYVSQMIESGILVSYHHWESLFDKCFRRGDGFSLKFQSEGE